MRVTRIIGFGLGTAGIACGASADIAVSPDAMVAPYDNAQMEIEWVEAVPTVAGVIRWTDPVTPGVSANIIDIASAQAGDVWTAPVSYAAGQAVTLGYAASPTSAELFSTQSDDMDGFVQIRSRVEGVYVIRSEALQGSVSDDAFFEHAMIIVRFAQLPAPGTATAVFAGALFAGRRRR